MEPVLALAVAAVALSCAAYSVWDFTSVALRSIIGVGIMGSLPAAQPLSDDAPPILLLPSPLLAMEEEPPTTRACEGQDPRYARKLELA